MTVPAIPTPPLSPSGESQYIRQLAYQATKFDEWVPKVRVGVYLSKKKKKTKIKNKAKF